MKEAEGSLVITTEGEVSETPISMQVYQAIYNDITGKTEKITDTYKHYYKVTLNDLMNLEKQLGQFCEQYHIESSCVSITIFHIKGRKERFSSFERLNTYNVTSLNPIERIYLEINLLIILPKVKTPQSYKIKLTLASGIAMIEGHESDFPRGIPASIIMRAMQNETAKCEVEYVDYIVARSISDLFRNWLESLPEVQINERIEWWQSRSHIVKQIVGFLFLIAASYFSSMYAIKYFSNIGAEGANLAVFLIVTFTSLFIIHATGNRIGSRIERAIDGFSSYGYSSIHINAGDKNLVTKYIDKNNSSRTKVIKELVLALVVGVLSSVIANYIVS